MRGGSRAALILAVALLAACGDADRPYPGHAKVLEKVAGYDLADLSELMRDARASEDPERQFVVAVASYLVDPVRYEERFVRYFPTRRVMDFVYEQLERSDITPSPLWSFAELGRIALDGSHEAIGKLVLVTGNARPPVSAVLCDALLRVFDVHTGATLDAIDRTPQEERGGPYACFEALPPAAARAALERLDAEAGNAPFAAAELRERLVERGDDSI